MFTYSITKNANLRKILSVDILTTNIMNKNMISAIDQKLLVKLTFYNTEGKLFTRTAAPMDYGPRRGWNSPESHYHFMAVGSNGELHPLSLKCDKLVEIKPLPFRFTPDDLVTWQPNWHYPRNWGEGCS